MQKSDLPTSEQLVQASRTMLWFALIVVLLLGGVVIGIQLFPNSMYTDTLTRFMQLLPLAIAIALFAIKRKAVSTNPTDSAMKEVLMDELRLSSTHRAYRYGFFFMLVLQPLLAFSLAHFQKNEVWLMCSISLTLGVSVLFASILVLDR